MKTFKLTRAIQIVLITILLVVIAIIVVGKISSSKTIATDLESESTVCGASENDNSNTTVTGDVTGDGEVDFKDLVKINRYRLNKITEL